VATDWNIYNPATGRYVDTFDYESAGLLSPEDCDDANTPRLCAGCKFEYECCGVRSF
jgi:hypothetical protein